MTEAKFIFHVSEDGFVHLDSSEYEGNPVAEKLHELLCTAQKDIINWRSKNLKK